ncbi:MAG: chitobiase/beta-hexosaminidase C-terminal domain-containing protein [Pirellulaceae bacterium]
MNFSILDFADARPRRTFRKLKAGIETSPAVADIPAGYFDSPFAVTLTTDSAGGTIYYSLDSSTPSPETGLVYTGEPDFD